MLQLGIPSRGVTPLQGPFLSEESNLGFRTQNVASYRWTREEFCYFVTLDGRPVGWKAPHGAG